MESSRFPALLIGGVGFALFTRPTAGGVRNLADPSAFASSSAAPFDSVTTTPSAPNRHRIDKDPSHPPTSLASAKGKPAPSTTPSAAIALTPLPSATTSSAVAATASTPTAATTSYNPSSAFVALGTLTTSGVARDPIAKKMSGALAQLSECYRDSLVAIGSPQGGSAEIQMSIDDAGKVVAIVLAPKNPAFQRCGSRPFGGFIVAKSDLQGGPATATQWLELKP